MKSKPGQQCSPRKLSFGKYILVFLFAATSGSMMLVVLGAIIGMNQWAALVLASVFAAFSGHIMADTMRDSDAVAEWARAARPVKLERDL